MIILFYFSYSKIFTAANIPIRIVNAFGKELANKILPKTPRLKMREILLPMQCQQDNQSQRRQTGGRKNHSVDTPRYHSIHTHYSQPIYIYSFYLAYGLSSAEYCNKPIKQYLLF
ncbi:hypothetical protein EDEG_00446 [Edhazardia aedis USNM 41457]|uniref:Uncharacterized protein n=1 Tax=Edhazardia aedis (strain USNM 41457) TaxID=1003232 RepID=J9D1K1_EDHAE|nr:hypothetical protein EDEG_00446 [Edhazardia aedis USNM 41457]|eukprot:EJW01454.1 hypothetical protein EDEG_00446 [Edhazardia aedis USNM 41457]